jgi:hypothetical protein
MIIDAHTHIYPGPVAEKAIRTIIGNANGYLDAYTNGTYNNLLTSMDDAQVDISIVLNVATNPKQGKNNLQWLKKMVNLSPRMIYFGSVHPYDADYKKSIKELKALGIQGLKFHPAYQQFPADAREAYRVYEEALNHDLILYFHPGFDLSMPESVQASIDKIAHVIKDFSGSKIILAHAGGIGEWDKILDLYSDKKCYYDTSFVLEDIMHNENAKELYRQNEDYFIFGTDSPWRDQKKYVDLINNSGFFTAEQKDKLFYKNILKLIKI